MEQEIIQLGAVAIIFGFAIKEFFGWLKIRKNGTGNDIKTQLFFINQKLDNHIQHISEDMTTIKEDVREIKSDILNLRLNKK